MNYSKKSFVPSQTKEEQIYVAPCIKCGSDDINVREYEDKYGFITTVSCKDCMEQVKINAGDIEGIKLWNSKNDVDQLIESKTALIAILKEELKKLKVQKRKSPPPFKQIQATM